MTSAKADGMLVSRSTCILPSLLPGWPAADQPPAGFEWHRLRPDAAGAAHKAWGLGWCPEPGFDSMSRGLGKGVAMNADKAGGIGCIGYPARSPRLTSTSLSLV